MTVRQRIIKQGPCAFCGGRFAFHREAEAQLWRVIGGDSLVGVAEDYNLTVRSMLSGWAALFDLLNEPPRGEA